MLTHHTPRHEAGGLDVVATLQDGFLHLTHPAGEPAAVEVVPAS